MTYRIAVIPGDGIGQEVTAEALRVLREVAALDRGITFEFEEFPWGTEHFLAAGEMMPKDGLQILASFDAIQLGAVGDPRVPDHLTLWGLLLPIRQGFGQYVNLRPVRLLPGAPTVLAGRGPQDIDMVFLRENTEGEYSGKGDFLFSGDPQREMALQTSVFSRVGCERIIRYGFELARRTRRSLTSVSKGNAMNYGGVFWDEVFAQVAVQYPDVRTQSLLVDAAAMLLVRDPSRFEVVVTSNLYGDILTDLGAGIAGGMGLAASANIDPTRRHPSLFEPVHGSAPDIAGKGIANPMAAIWSAALLLDHLGHGKWAERVVEAIERTLSAGVTSPDLGGSATTEEVGRLVARELGATSGKRVQA
ncbi:MAG: tartrate dehydrogenase [Thermaerobacter sp.]|nr:tartrate dehydrogenase [Thermaerobacter sp.]